MSDIKQSKKPPIWLLFIVGIFAFSVVSNIIKDAIQAGEKPSAAVEKPLEKKKEVVRNPEMEKLQRQAYGESLRNKFLDKGADIKVSVAGKNSDRISMTFSLFNDVWSHRFEKEGSIKHLCELGFTKISMSDGYNWGYEWTCSVSK